MYEAEQVTIDEGKNYADKVGCIFQKTSAKAGSGVDELFNKLGKQLINPDNEDFNTLTKDEIEERYYYISSILNGDSIKKISRKNKNNKGCC